ncbi:Fpg/Nei family DNA glycosylase [Streptomyces sp. ST2-7A]|uniref:Fpg/Nei family DNA glycosylase n=1 Tax=Streptomyces sp. ST2-7A TaxID=2907214 RepID=UPI001F3E7BEA|nr:DNA-formamidopyrimidine glycosylase family protein [Streptomyces sp. ST2-7A]MCE7079237.1 Fpg/Nei family DNA glycosylase [Streptomyces sp. ST2-7A]
MPEGHTIHRLAGRLGERFGGRSVRVDSPTGRFADGAALIDGHRLTATEAHGKHLFLSLTAPGTPPGAAAPDGPVLTRLLHVHLGLYGSFRLHRGPAGEPEGQVRLRLATEEDHAVLRGPRVCELITRGEKQEFHRSLGPDPLRNDAEPDRAFARISRSRVPVAALLMEQRILAGVGNVYRAEVLFRNRVDPHLPGRELDRERWEAIWRDLTVLMPEGVRTGRIDTVRPEHAPEAMGRPPRRDDHGGEVYVYRRLHQRCFLCGGWIRAEEMRGRNLFWCPGCQKS